jgi:hypothetical protein
MQALLLQVIHEEKKRADHAKGESAMTEEWAVKQTIDDMIKFCIHIRHQSEKMQRELMSIREDLDGTDAKQS